MGVTRWLLTHAIHLSPLLWLGAWFARMKYRERSARAPARAGGRAPAHVRARAGAPAPAGLVRLVVACSVGAAAVHAAVISEHFRESALYGWFFVLSALAQVTWGVLVARRGDRDLLVAGALGNTLIVTLWVVTRTAGLPVGPEPWRPEAVGSLDVLATALEVGLVTGSIALLRINAFRLSSNE